MIHFRTISRSIFLSTVGSLTKISTGVHILNGHIANFNTNKNISFDSQLKKLSNECKFINIEEAVFLIKNKIEVKDPLVAFTFDDGYIDCYTDIAPALNKFNINAAFFINPNFMDGTEKYKENFLKTKVPNIPARNAMTRTMVADLSREGFIIGAHTLDHVRLVDLKFPEIMKQTVGCKLAIEEIIDKPCEYFAWTYGKFSDIDNVSLSTVLENFSYVFSSDGYQDYMTDLGVINRRHFECNWPYSHIKYFLSKKRR